MLRHSRNHGTQRLPNDDDDDDDDLTHTVSNTPAMNGTAHIVLQQSARQYYLDTAVIHLQFPVSMGFVRSI